MSLEYQKRLQVEAIIKPKLSDVDYIHLYATYGSKKIPRLKKRKRNRYNIQALGCIPLSETDVVNIRLYTDSKDQPHDFTMQWLRREPEYNDFKITKVRTDLGHGKSDYHTDIEISYEKGTKKPRKVVVRQDKFDDYEQAITTVLIQAEKFYELVGAEFWLSPTSIHPHRVLSIYKRWKNSNLYTSLTVLSRSVCLNIIDKTRNFKVSDDMFDSIVEETIGQIKERENDIGTALQVVPRYTSYFSPLPFPFIVPEEPRPVEYFLKAYDSNGLSIPLETLGLVFESKGSENLTSRYNKQLESEKM